MKTNTPEQAPAAAPPELTTERLLELLRQGPATTVQLTVRAGLAANAEQIASVRALLDTLFARGAVAQNQTTKIWTAVTTAVSALTGVTTGAALKKFDAAKAPPAPLARLKLGTPRQVRVGSIRYDEAENVRSMDGGVEVIKLAKLHPAPDSEEGMQLAHELQEILPSLPEQGLIEPPICALEADGSLTLIAGYRRLAAVILLYGLNAEIVVMVRSYDAGERLAVNLAENGVRRSVVGWRCINRCWQLSQPPYRYTARAIASAGGYSESYTANMVRFRRAVSPVIWGKWTAGDGSPPFEKMLTLAPHTHEQQLEMWNEWHHVAPPKSRTEGGADDEDDDDDAPAPAPPPRVEACPPAADLARALLVRVRTARTGGVDAMTRAYLDGAETALLATLDERPWTLPRAWKITRTAPPARPGVKKTTPAKKAAAKKAAPKKTTKKPATKRAAKKGRR